jgi:hypothetical protein
MSVTIESSQLFEPGDPRPAEVERLEVFIAGDCWVPSMEVVLRKVI